MQIESNETPSLVAGVTREYLLHHKVCPSGLDPSGALHIVVVATAPKALREAIGELAAAYKRLAIIDEVSITEVERLIERLTTESDRSLELASADAYADDFTTDVRDLANRLRSCAT